MGSQIKPVISGHVDTDSRLLRESQQPLTGSASHLPWRGLCAGHEPLEVENAIDDEVG